MEPCGGYLTVYFALEARTRLQFWAFWAEKHKSIDSLCTHPTDICTAGSIGNVPTFLHVFHESGCFLSCAMESRRVGEVILWPATRRKGQRKTRANVLNFEIETCLGGRMLYVQPKSTSDSSVHLWYIHALVVDSCWAWEGWFFIFRLTDRTNRPEPNLAKHHSPWSIKMLWPINSTFWQNNPKNCITLFARKIFHNFFSFPGISPFWSAQPWK